jgi:hypothetical protein
MSGHGEKRPLAASVFFSPNKQKTEHQSESNSVTSWIPNLWKASLYHAALKKEAPFLLASQLQSCLSETAEQTGEHHVPCMTPLPTPWENNPP